MKIERIVVSAVVYSTEDREKVAMAMATLFPFEFEIVRTPAKGHFGNPIEYLEVEITKKKQIKEFWNNLIKLLGDQRNYIINTLEERIDDQGQLFIRFDKQKAYLGEIEVTEKGDAVVVKAKLVTYPAKREKIVEFAKEILEKGYK
ncbi:RNA-binding domain-containing protein [Archaeoglobus sp.]